MTLLALSSVSVQFGADPLLAEMSFTVAAGERWGIVGRNGTGKTTLLNLIRGTQEPESGFIHRKPGLRMTMLDQHREFGNSSTVWEAAAGGYQKLLDLERSVSLEVERLGSLGDSVDDSDLIRLDRLQEQFHHEGGYAYHARVDAVLQGLGFDAEAARTRPLTNLSGGERGRVGLAAQLAAPADLILLDEPTNHLDLDTIDWLRRHLEESGKTVLVISHDRAFLDDFADHILHLSQGSALPYRGGYSAFVAQRARTLLTQQREAEEQRKEIARQEEFVRRNIAGQKTVQAKSRRKKLARLPRLSPPPVEDDPMAVRFEAADRGGDQVLIAEDLGVGIGGAQLIGDFSAIARRGDVIAVVGPNGAGKSTLLATLLGDRPPMAGRVRIGAGISPAWFRQDHAHLPSGRTLFDCIADARPTWNRGDIQGHLGRFGFSGETVQRTTDSLSGGERARVALALITLRGANLLALDEPTNHLDVESIEALEDALEDYPGTVLLVSHDRALLRELTTRVWAFADGHLHDYPGPFVDWEEKVARELETRTAASAESDRKARAEAKQRTRKASEARRAAEAPLRAARKALGSAEKDVQKAEAVVAEIEAALADPTLYDGSPERSEEAGRLTARLREAQLTLEDTMAGWIEAHGTLEALESPGSGES
ncbi:MAG: ABC-F family ATP-binding cassette domain-containing protein [Gemmatimonadetes bacterium]|nr:ABC-F family ATP-binding cassette domain-containing protein [Gemmatimonadota bacterium]NNM06239.1 ABC-F family ATP-binding cassette domain-containing protein [Gemmatimonadota bacterium]